MTINSQNLEAMCKMQCTLQMFRAHMIDIMVAAVEAAVVVNSSNMNLPPFTRRVWRIKIILYKKYIKYNLHVV